MKRTRIWMLGAFILVSALLVLAVIKRNQSPLYQLSRYPQTPAFKRYVFDVSSELSNPITPALISINELVSKDFGEVLEYRMSPGTEFDLITRDFRVSSSGSGRAADLTKEQSEEIRQLVQQLPPSMVIEKRENLLVVLIYQPTPTQLRFYDKRNPPPQIRAIVGILTDAMQKDINSLLPGQTIDDLPHLRSKLRPSNAQNAVN